MKAIRTFCCSCDKLVDVFHIEGEGNVDVQGDRCFQCVTEQANEAKKPWKRVPKLGVIVNDSKDFDRMMNERKVNSKLSQPNKKRAKR